MTNPAVLIAEDDGHLRAQLSEMVRVEGRSEPHFRSLKRPFAATSRSREVRAESPDAEAGTPHHGAGAGITQPADEVRSNEIAAPAQNGSKGSNEPAEKYGPLRGRSAPMLELYRQIDRVGPTSASVLLHGETGSGKDVVARAIHEISRARGGEFVALNCGAISASLVESELFGHEPGSFTGAIRKHDGVFARANRGTLFLDEITEMPLDLQVKLLRVLETGTFHRLGGEKPVVTNARIIAATNRSPEVAVREGKLREDLYYRLRVFPILVPPLRERDSDVVLLAQHFLEQLNEDYGEHRRFTTAALKRLQSHEWRGNVRELKHLVHRAFLLADRDLEVDTLHLDEVSPCVTNRLEIEVGSSIAAMEQKLILATMSQLQNNKSKVAKVLGISLKTLYIRLSIYQAGGCDLASLGSGGVRAATANRS
ncbi:MAG: sigma-54 dependent transcriptional regulator [Planctomycetota bacterium]